MDRERESTRSRDDGRTGVGTASRAAAVRATRLLEIGPEPAFDRLCRLAATILDAPLAYRTVVDDVRSFLKGAPDSAALCGPDGTFSAPARETACQLVVDSGQEVVSSDTAADPRLRDLVRIKAFGARAWPGVPVLDPDGYVLGNMCAIDFHVREWTAADLDAMRTLAAAANDAIGLRLAAEDLAHYAEETAELAEILQESLPPAHAPQVPGMAIANRFSPGGTGVDVLGDFYDVVVAAARRHAGTTNHADAAVVVLRVEPQPRQRSTTAASGSTARKVNDSSR